MPSLEEFEAQVKATTTAKHRQEISLVEKLLNAYLAGFGTVSQFTLSEDNELGKRFTANLAQLLTPADKLL